MVISIASNHPVGRIELGMDPVATLARVNDAFPLSDHQFREVPAEMVSKKCSAAYEI